MATIFTHAILVYGFYSLYKFRKKEILFWVILSSIVPDFDVLAFTFGIPYEDTLGHRGFTHSILFAILWSLIVVFLRFKNHYPKQRILLFSLFFISTISHGILDAMTNGGLGVGFFIPFENSRYFMPWTPIEVSPIGRHFFSKSGLVTIISEIRYVLLPMGLLFLGPLVYKKVFKN